MAVCATEDINDTYEIELGLEFASVAGLLEVIHI